jgi:heme A synthase
MLQLHLQDRLQALGLGFVIEHAHRLAGFAVGTCAIVLAVGLWRSAPRPWMRWLGVAALAGVSLQGVLGIFRVNLHELMGPYLALVHGCFGQMVFALLVSIVLLTSHGWLAPADGDVPTEQALRLRRTALLVVALVVVQLVAGAFLRHRVSPMSQRLHLLFAFAVAAGATWLLKQALDERAGNRRLAWAAGVLAGLVGLQLMLGVEAWMIRFEGMGYLAPEHVVWRRDLVRTGHVLAGSLILATSVLAALEAYRQPLPATDPAAAPLGRLEGVA